MAEGLRVRTGIRRDDVAISDQLVLINQQSLDSDWPAGMSFVRADADFGAEAVAESIGETGRRIPVNPCGIDFIQETPGILTVFCHDAVGMGRTVLMNVVDRFIQALDDLHVHNQIEILRTEPRIPQFDAGILEGLQHFLRLPNPA